jgi:GT2 family glycosyltransferase
MLAAHSGPLSKGSARVKDPCPRASRFVRRGQNATHALDRRSNIKAPDPEARTVEQKRITEHAEASERIARLARETLRRVETERLKLERETERLAALADQRGAMIDAIYASTSWRLLAPARIIIRLLKRAASGRTQSVSQPLADGEALPPEAHPDAPISTAALLRPVLAAELRDDLQNFLAKDERLVFPSVTIPDISIVLVLFNRAHFTLQCLRSILKQDGPSIEVIVFDNASDDDTNVLLNRADNLRVIRSVENLGFLRGVNQAVAHARGEAILLLNNDAALRYGALDAAWRALTSDPRIGAVGGRLVSPDGTLQEAGCLIWSDGTPHGYANGMPFDTPKAKVRRDVDYCSGAFLLTRRADFQAMGGFDEVFAPAYCEDSDYCMRLWQSGHRVVYEPGAVVDHFESGSEASRQEIDSLNARNRKIFAERYAVELASHCHASLENVECAMSRRANLSDSENLADFRISGASEGRKNGCTSQTRPLLNE